MKEVPEGFYKATQDITVYKKAYTKLKQGRIVTLVIPKGTLIYKGPSWNRDKYRADKAIVKDTQKQKLHSGYDHNFLYVKGKTIYPRWPFSQCRDSCASGIHFFATKKQARNWFLLKW